MKMGIKKASKTSEAFPIIFTLGHSNRQLIELIDVLKKATVETIIDCRSYPTSRWPQFKKNHLKVAIEQAGMSYEWRGNNIGGLERNVAFDDTLDELSKRSYSGEIICLLCSEADPTLCHRHSKLEPELITRRVKVSHLLYEKSSKQAALFGVDKEKI